MDRQKGRGRHLCCGETLQEGLGRVRDIQARDMQVMVGIDEASETSNNKINVPHRLIPMCFRLW